MVRRKTPASSVVVFRDDPDMVSPSITSDNNNNSDDDDDDTSHHLSPPRKKSRLRKESPASAATAVLRTRRAALKEKATNPSSSDNSFLRSTDKHGLSHENPQKAKRKKTIPGCDTIKAPDSIVESTSQLQGVSDATSPVYQALKKELPTEEFDELLSLIAKDTTQNAAHFIAKKGCWSPELLNCFGRSDLRSLDLSSPASPSGVFVPHMSPGLTIKVLFQQHLFSKLTIISLRNTPLLNDDIAFLRLLPCLEDIDLFGTGIGTQSLHHLVCHRHTLKKLNLSHNSSIDDDSRVALSTFISLIALYLRGTSFTMPGLRRLVSDSLTQSCRLLSIPTHCIDYLNRRQERYIVDIPTNYIQDPGQVAALTMAGLKRNLELHAKANRDVQVSGTKVELVSRLTAILSNRFADQKIIKVLGR